jgi:hypothetical protein
VVDLEWFCQLPNLSQKLASSGTVDMDQPNAAALLHIIPMDNMMDFTM